jgi:hypothetical protein
MFFEVESHLRCFLLPIDVVRVIRFWKNMNPFIEAGVWKNVKEQNVVFKYFLWISVC